MTKLVADEVTNTLLAAIDNANPAAVQGPNGLQLTCGPFDEHPALMVVLHGDFITVSKEGDSETFLADDEGAAKAAGLIVELCA